MLADLDRVYTEGEAPENFLTAFEAHLEGIVTTIKEFGGFPRIRLFVAYLIAHIGGFCEYGPR